MQRWLLGLLIFLFSSLLMLNSFTIGQFRNVPTVNSINNEGWSFYIITFWPLNIFIIKKIYVILITESNNIDIKIKPQPLTTNGYLIDNEGCRIPDLGLFESSTRHLIKKAKPIICDHGSQLPLVDSNNSAIFVNSEAKLHYYNETESVDCCWRNFWRTGNGDNDFK